MAKTALEDGHEVSVFCAGDGVTSLHEITTNEHLSALKAGGAALYASGKSAKARGINPEQLDSLGFTPATPNKFIDLCFDADRTIVY